MNAIWKWLWGLSEVEKVEARRPEGLSRRGFLRAIGVTAVTVGGGGLLIAKGSINPLGVPRWQNFVDPYEDDVARLIGQTLEDLGRPNFVDIAAHLRKHQAMTKLLTRGDVAPSFGVFTEMTFVSPKFKPRETGVMSNE